LNQWYLAWLRTGHGAQPAALDLKPLRCDGLHQAGQIIAAKIFNLPTGGAQQEMLVPWAARKYRLQPFG
jgi:hypothetical protein